MLFAPSASGLIQRITDFFGAQVAENMIEVEHTEHHIGTVRGYVSLPPLARGNSRTQYTFLNGRYIRDRGIQAAISEAYRGRLISGQYPIVFLSYVINADKFDVNVHPTKIEVRFAEHLHIFPFTLRAITSALQGHSGPLSISPEAPSIAPAEHRESIKRSILDFYKGGGSRRESGGRLYPQRQGDADYIRPQEIAAPQQINAHDLPEDAKDVSGWKYLGTLADTYILFSEGGALIAIDQHALHERILFDELMRREGTPEVHRLLIPQVVELTPIEFALWEESAEALRKAGFDTEQFGGRTVAVQAIPQSFPVSKCAEVLQRSVAELASAGQKATKDPQKLFESMACKAAVKAGNLLSISEISALVRRYREIEKTAPTCPHGRPAVVKIPVEQIAKWFKRK